MSDAMKNWAMQQPEFKQYKNRTTEMSENNGNGVYKAIAAVMGDLAKQGIGKNETNTFDKYKFRGIDSVYNALAPLLSKHGLLILPRVLERYSEERSSGNGKALFYITVAAEFDFVAAEDGSKHTVRAYGEAMDRGDKGTNKAMTAAYKNACFEAFCIPTEGSNDADSESHEVDAAPDTSAAEAALRECESLPDLQKIWKKLGEPNRRALEGVKEEMKQALKVPA